MSTFHPEINGYSHAEMISMATVTRLWILLGHVPVTMCMSACVHLCLCAWACVCVCVCVCVYEHVCMDIKNMCVCVRMVYICVCVCELPLHEFFDYPSQVSNDTALIRLYNIHFYYSLQVFDSSPSEEISDSTFHSDSS